MLIRVVICCCMLISSFVLGGLTRKQDDQRQSVESSHSHQETNRPTIGGDGDVLLHVPKKFAKLIEIDATANQVRLQAEGEDLPKTWSVNADAEIKVNGWWGRLDQFHTGDRVWVWFDINRNKQPISILMLADELSEKQIHGTAPSDELEPLQNEQRQYMRSVWKREGLPGTVSVLHKLSGEMDVLLDHEAIRWGRFLDLGDQVTLNSELPIRATVKQVEPWRERTLIRLVTSPGLDQADLSLGQRIQLIVPEPPVEVQASHLPTDIGRERPKHQRVEWFLASVYCTCNFRGDQCTGMFYTLASCSPTGCGNPNATRETVGSMIDAGMSDRDVLDKLLEDRGPQLLQPHLLR